MGFVVLSLFFVPGDKAHAQRQAPRGSYLMVAGAVLGGYGGQLGYFSVKDFYTREALVLADLHAALDPGNGSNQVVFFIGGSLRTLGFKRTIGNTPYKGFDLDVGFRVGPGFTFSTRETRADKNRRFNLFVEPYARLSVGVGARNAMVLEWATTRPGIRIGIWLYV